jgi:ribosomal-protein-alanine N-acetyltransferase
VRHESIAKHFVRSPDKEAGFDMERSFIYHTDRLLLKVLNETGARAVLSYYLRNRPFHQPFFATRDESVFTLAHQKRILAADYRDFVAGRALHLYIFLKDNEQRMIGRIAFSNIVRGCFHSCFMGYHLDEQSQGFGYACEAARAALKIMFEDFGLHRIEANIMPRNSRSISLVQRLGFELEELGGSSPLCTPARSSAG